MTQEIDMVELVERVVKLEEQQKVLHSQNTSIQTKLDLLITRFTKYEAKWGGVLMVLSAIGALALALKGEILKAFGLR